MTLHDPATPREGFARSDDVNASHTSGSGTANPGNRGGHGQEHDSQDDAEAKIAQDDAGEEPEGDAEGRTDQIRASGR